MQQSSTWSFLPNYASNNRIASFGVAYDAAGNITTDQLGNTYAYDAEEMLKASSSGGNYTYNANGARARKDAAGAWTEYINFGGNTIAEKNSDGAWTDYVFANGERIAQFDHGKSGIGNTADVRS